MSRELKFRAWDGEKLHAVMSLLGTNFCKVPKKAYPYSEEIVVKYVMQYTGIKDDNGVEVCEGDIIKLTTLNDVYYEVYWDEYALAFLIKDNESIGDLYSVNMSEFLVIGNIYENKNLI